VSAAADHRLTDLLVRYWDGALTRAETRELERRLATDPAAREWFHEFALQVVTVADLPAPSCTAGWAEPTAPQTRPTARGAARPSRRRVLWALGGLAVGTAAPVGRFGLGPPAPVPAPGRAVRLAAIRGGVAVRGADGTDLWTGGAVPTGSTVSTNGPGASVMLLYPNGTNVALTENSAVTFSPNSSRLRLDRGVIAADLRSPNDGVPALALATAEALVTGGTRAAVALTQAVGVTELDVQHGSANVSAPGGRWLSAVSGGELLTVGSDGGCRKQTHPVTPEEFGLELSRPLPADWAVGRLAAGGDRPALVPEFWFDPFHQRSMYQIRANKAWTRGFF
jgi:hypothetical protein